MYPSKKVELTHCDECSVRHSTYTPTCKYGGVVVTSLVSES